MTVPGGWLRCENGVGFIDGVSAPTPTGGAVFHPAIAIAPLAIATVQAKLRRRLLRASCAAVY